MIAPNSKWLKEKLIEWWYESEKDRKRRLLGPRMVPAPVAPHVIKARQRAPKLRTFIRGNARMT